MFEDYRNPNDYWMPHPQPGEQPDPDEAFKAGCFGAFFYIPIVAMKYVFAIAAALQVLEILWYVYLWFRSRDRKKQKNNN